MAKRLIFTGRISHTREWTGFPERDHLREQVNDEFAGSKVKMIFQENYPDRSAKQNKYYWGGVIRPIMRYLYEEMGHDHLNWRSNLATQKFHRELFMTLWTDRVQNLVSPKSGEVIMKLTVSSSELSTVEFMAYIEVVRKWSLDQFGLYIREPKEQGLLFDE